MSGPPLPPADFATRPLPVLALRRGSSLHRFYTRGKSPLYFDRSTDSRFNAPDATYGVCYMALRPAGAFAETFMRNPGRTTLPADLVTAKAYVRLELTATVRIATFFGPDLAKLGATAEVCHRSQPYEVPQAWSKAIFAHPTSVDGLAYTARHDDSEVCVALFDRRNGLLSVAERRVQLDAEWFWKLAERYGVGLFP